MAGGPLAESFLEHRAALFRYLRARGAGDDADDLLQELWLRLDGVETITGDNRAYLYRMAHNLMLDRVRAGARRRGREHAYQHDRLSGEVDEAPLADQTLVARERLAEVDALLRALGERTDYAFRRFRVDDVPQRDIANELGISVSAVEKHLQKAYRALAQLQHRRSSESVEER